MTPPRAAGPRRQRDGTTALKGHAEIRGGLRTRAEPVRERRDRAAPYRPLRRDQQGTRRWQCGAIYARLRVSLHHETALHPLAARGDNIKANEPALTGEWLANSLCPGSHCPG